MVGDARQLQLGFIEGDVLGELLIRLAKRLPTTAAEQRRADPPRPQHLLSPLGDYNRGPTNSVNEEEWHGRTHVDGTVVGERLWGGSSSMVRGHLRPNKKEVAGW